ncbi:MAG: hypothetical protein ACLQJF_21135 [Candidatus Sulfotelmatobacter sp.]|jgi:hypothetical protein
MSTPAVTPQSDPFAEFGGASTGNANPQAKPSQPQPAQPASDPFKEFGGVSVDPETKATNNPQQTGEITNDVGQKVIVPKDGESFQDTMRRAVQYHQSLTPEQQKAAISAETETIPKKAAQTIAAAPAIGAVGTAALAAPGEIVQGVRTIPGITDALLKHAETKAGEWAAQYPNLIGVAKALGVPTSVAAVLGWLYHNSKGIGGK